MCILALSSQNLQTTKVMNFQHFLGWPVMLLDKTLHFLLLFFYIWPVMEKVDMPSKLICYFLDVWAIELFVVIIQHWNALNYFFLKWYSEKILILNTKFAVYQAKFQLYAVLGGMLLRWSVRSSTKNLGKICEIREVVCSLATHCKQGRSGNGCQWKLVD